MPSRCWGVALVGVLAAFACTACGPRQRKEAKEMVDFGFTTSKKFGFAFTLPGDYFNVTPIGYSNVDGTFHGIGRRQVGAVAIHDHSWGILLAGSRKFQLGQFDPNEIRDLSPRELAALKAEGKPLPTETRRYTTGAVGMLAFDNIGNRASFYT